MRPACADSRNRTCPWRPEPAILRSTARIERDAIAKHAGVVRIADGLDAEGPVRAERGGRTAAPSGIEYEQVVERGLRHMAWLAEDDPVVATELPPAWHRALATYAPEPFRNLG